MPSQQDVPATSALLKVYGAEINALHARDADTHRGSGYDIHGGAAAILFHRQGIRDRDGFRASYFDTCQGDAADALITTRYQVARIIASRGAGIAALSRPIAAGGGGTFFEGTRLSILASALNSPLTFEVAADTVIGASALQARVPIRTLEAKASQPIDAFSSSYFLTLEDPVWDTTWVVNEIQCGSGTDKERDDDYKARTKALRQSQRLGYEKSIEAACNAVGAAEVALFASDWGGIDHGINHCFVADSNFVTTDALLTACRMAVDGARVLGPDLFVFGMENTPLSLAVTINVWSIEQTRASDYLADLAKAAVLDFFSGRQNAFYWTTEAIASAVFKQVRGDAQSVTVTPSLSAPDRGTMLDTDALKRYVVTASSVTVDVRGPT